MVWENETSTEQEAKRIQDAVKQMLGKLVIVEFYVKFDSRCPIFESMSQI